MEISEKELEDMICLKNAETLLDRGLGTFQHDHLLRQFNLGCYGIADLIGISATTDRGPLELFVTIYELKKDEIGMSALGQICRYKRAMEEYFYEELECEIEVSMVLIGSKIESSSNFVYTASEIELLTVYTYDISLTGVQFNEIDLSEFGPSNRDMGWGQLAKTDFSAFARKPTKLKSPLTVPF